MVARVRRSPDRPATTPPKEKKKMPKRIKYRMQYRNQMPANTIYVGRPSSYGNPFKVRTNGRDDCNKRYRKWLMIKMDAGTINIERLRGKNLACWCALDQECHADILLEVANQEMTTDEMVLPMLNERSRSEPGRIKK